jgi:hypothetical protein
MDKVKYARFNGLQNRILPDTKWLKVSDPLFGIISHLPCGTIFNLHKRPNRLKDKNGYTTIEQGIGLFNIFVTWEAEKNEV